MRDSDSSPRATSRAKRPAVPRRRAARARIESTHRARGFTLIEILVVVVIIAVLAAALTLSVGGLGGERVLSNQSDRFQALLAHACAEAELSGREIGVVMQADGYAFRRLDGNEWRDFASGAELRARQWPQGLKIELTREGRPLELAATADQTPQLVCFSSGELTPFALVLSLNDDAARYRVHGEDDGTLKADRLDTPR